VEEHLLKAEHFLRAIKLRGDRACEALEFEDWEGFQKAMRWKTAAFHHFRAVDYILREQDPTYLQSERMQGLWKDIQDSDQALRSEIEKHHAKLEQQLSKVRQNRAAHARFHSGNKEFTGYRGSV
jgi:glucuronate isomerase